jgi:hypothetical protein
MARLQRELHKSGEFRENHKKICAIRIFRGIRAKGFLTLRKPWQTS